MDDMNCRACLYWLQAYIDSEALDAEIEAKLHAHLDGCPKCRERLAALELLRQGVRERLPYHPAPSDMSRQVLARAEAEERTAQAQRAERRASWARLALAAVVLAIVAILYFAASSSRDGLAEDFVARHEHSLLEDHLTDLATSDPAMLAAWFAARLDRAPPVADFDRAGYRLLGGRLDFIEHRTIAALVYGHQGHPINVFVMPATKADRPLRRVTRGGANLIAWRQGQWAYWAVADLDTKDLQALRQLIE
ncbi:hypothetical protein CKO41_10885 [Thiococcus pfennigii]|nr:hypothetical protein [Thiococcus pfennigii]MBK1732285.1 hypothetical protein [Thiococcus pfennigii]